jgi:hypothetical protein
VNLEDVIRRGLDDLGGDTQPPAPDPVALRRSAQRSRRVRVAASLGLTAAVAAGVVVGLAGLRDRDSSRDPTSPRPDTQVTVVRDAVWGDGGFIHDGRAKHLIVGALTTNLAPSLDGVAYGVRGGDIIYQPTKGESVRIAQHAPLGPAADPTSGLIAWFEDVGGVTDLVVHTVDVGQVARVDVGSLDVERPEAIFGRSQPPILWVGENHDDGVTVFFTADGHTWRFDSEKPAGERLARVPGDPVDASLDVLAEETSAEGDLVFVDASGDRLSEPVSVEYDGSLSHDGKTYAGYSQTMPFSVVDTSSGRMWPAQADGVFLPISLASSRGEVVMFFDADYAGESTTPPSGSVYACTTSDGLCHVVDVEIAMTELALPDF